MLTLAMFKNSNKILNIEKPVRIKNYELKRKNSNYRVGILSGGLFQINNSSPIKFDTKKETESKKETQNNKQIVEHDNNVLSLVETNVVTEQKLSSDLLYYHIKGSKSCDNIFVTSTKGVFKSDDFGKNWIVTDAPTNILYTFLYVSKCGKNIIVAGLEGEFFLKSTILYYSNNSGSNFLKSSMINIIGDRINSVTYHKNNYLCLTDNGKIFLSQDMNVWKKINKLKGNYTNSLISANYKLYSIVKEKNNYYIKISKNNCDSWFNLKKINKGYSLLVSENHQNLIYINYEKPFYNIYVSKSYGKVWKKTLSLKNRVYLVSDKDCKNVVCVTYKNNMYSSNNYGLTWSRTYNDKLQLNLFLMSDDGKFKLTM